MDEEEFNYRGGRQNSSYKSEGRRRTGRIVQISGLRTSSNKNEIYASVVKLFGNNICIVSCADGKERVCIIRGKFRGNAKSSNRLSQDTVVLVGLRTFEQPAANGKEKCDLLEVYNAGEVRKLKQRNITDLGARDMQEQAMDDYQFDTSVDPQSENADAEHPDEAYRLKMTQPDRYKDFNSDEDSDIESDVDIEDL